MSTLADDKGSFSRTGNNTPFRSVLDKKAALTGWSYELKVIIKELQQEAQNVHILDDEYLRFVVWYGIYMLNEDVVMKDFQLLIATGIVEYWKEKAVEIKSAQVKEKFRGEMFPGETSAAAALVQSGGQDLGLTELLILEPISLWAAGMLVTVVVFVVRGVILFRARRKLAGGENFWRIEKCKGGCVLLKMCDGMNGFCPYCKAALKWRLALNGNTGRIQTCSTFRRNSY